MDGSISDRSLYKHDELEAAGATRNSRPKPSEHDWLLSPQFQRARFPRPFWRGGEGVGGPREFNMLNFINRDSGANGSQNFSFRVERALSGQLHRS
jgi:hypothetical protein